MRILIVEDEEKVAKALRDGLEAEHYQVQVAGTGEEGFFLVNHESFDLVVLDLMLPGRDGLEVLTTLRKRGLPTPVLILTARDTVDDRVIGLDSGADDYLVKRRELVHQIQRHLGKQVYRAEAYSIIALAVWDPALKNYGPNLGYDYGGRLTAAWLDR